MKLIFFVFCACIIEWETKSKLSSFNKFLFLILFEFFLAVMIQAIITVEN